AMFGAFPLVSERVIDCHQRLRWSGFSGPEIPSDAHGHGPTATRTPALPSPHVNASWPSGVQAASAYSLVSNDSLSDAATIRGATEVPASVAFAAKSEALPLARSY